MGFATWATNFNAMFGLSDVNAIAVCCRANKMFERMCCFVVKLELLANAIADALDNRFEFARDKKGISLLEHEDFVFPMNKSA